jgi:hypothetical protein
MACDVQPRKEKLEKQKMTKGTLNGTGKGEAADVSRMCPL